MLHDLLVEIKLDKFTCYRCLETSAIEAACSEIDAAQLQTILQKYAAADDVQAQQYLHGTEQNIKLLTDMAAAVGAPETAADVFNQIRDKEPLYYRCLVEVFKAWYKKTGPFPSPAATFSEFQLDSPCVGKTFKEWHKQVQQGTAAPAPADAEAPANADKPADANADKPADAPADAPAPATPPAP